MRKRVKKLLITILSSLFVCSLLVVGGINFPTAKAEITTSDFYVSGAGVRLINDQNGSGLRFHTLMDKDVYNELQGTNYRTGTLIMPELLDVDRNIDLGDANAVKINTTDLWYESKTKDGYMQSTAYLYDIPVSSYGARMIAVSYVEMADGSVIYTNPSPATSMSDVATSAIEEDSSLSNRLSVYVVEEATVNLRYADGSTVSQTLPYGSLIEEPEFSGEKEGCKFIGWVTRHGKIWDFEKDGLTGTTTLTETYEQYKGKFVVAPSVYEIGADLGGGSQIAETAEIAPAKGFDSVYKYKNSSVTSIHGKSFSGVNLDNYSKVCFAVKTAKFNFNNETTKEFNDWIYFSLAQTALKTWDLAVTYKGETVYTKTGLNGAYETNENYTDNALDAILYGNPSGFYPTCFQGETLKVYVSELRGDYNSNYKIDVAEVIADSAFTDTTIDNTVTAPSGYSVVSSRTNFRGSSGAGDIQFNTFSCTDISQYDKVTFKTLTKENYYILAGNWLQDVNGWVEWKLTKISIGWNVTITNSSGSEWYNKDLTGTTLVTLLGASDSEASLGAGDYHSANGQQVWVTELMGIKKVSYSGIEIATEKILTDSIVTAERAPTGYNSVYTYNMSGETGTDNVVALANIESVDISKYTEISFKMKSTGSFILVEGSNAGGVYHRVNENGDWIEVRAKNNDDGTWTVSYPNCKRLESWTEVETLTATFNRRGKTLSEILVFGFDVRTPCTVIYITELKGYLSIGYQEEIPELPEVLPENYYGEIIADSAYENGIDVGGGQFSKTSELGAPSGFKNVYKYQSTEFNIHGKSFSGINLDAYEEVSFALKTASFNFNGETTKELSGWMIFTLKQTSLNIWDLTVTHNGETVYTKTGLNGAYNSNANPAYSNNAIDAILYGNPSGFYPQAKDGDLTVYCTEIRAKKNAVTFEGEKIVNSALDNATSVNNVYCDGFERVNKVDALEEGAFSDVDLLPYKTIRFGIMGEKSLVMFDGWGSYQSSHGVWCVVTATKNVSGSWSVEIGNCSATTQFSFDSFESFQAFLNGFTQYSTDGNDTVYATEIRGERDLNYVDQTKTDADDFKVYDLIADSAYESGIDVGGGQQFSKTSEISAPSGFKNVYKYQSTEFNIHGKSFSGINLDSYKEVRFAIKTASFNFNGETVKEISGWMVFVLTQTSLKTWDLTVTHNGETVYAKTGLNGAYNSSANPAYGDNAVDAILYGNPSGFYPQAKDGDLTVYCTELLGKETDENFAFSDLSFDAIAVDTPNAEDEFNYGELEFATRELRDLYKEITGKELLIEYVTDIDELDLSKRYFVLGKNLASQKGYTCYGLTTESGYKLICEDGFNTYIYGSTVYGDLRGVYGYLNAVYNLDFFTDTVYTYTNSDKVSGEMNIVVNPDIDHNFAYDGAITYIVDPTGAKPDNQPNWKYQRRLGFTNSWEYSYGWHNFTTIISESEFKSAHPNWFVEGTDDSESEFITLNLSYNGFEMASTVADKIFAIIKADEENGTYRQAYNFSAPDNRGWSSLNPYDTAAEEYIRFMNKVAENLDKKDLGRNIELQLLAYNKTYEAPSYSDELKFYSGKHVTLGVMIAPVEMNMYRDFDDTVVDAKYGRSNAWYKEQITKWAKFGGKLHYWGYSAYFDNYFVPLDSITNMQSKYQELVKQGVSTIIDLGQVGMPISPDWSALKLYLKSKLSQDVNADVNALITNFCNAYYGSAGATMKTLLGKMQARYKVISDMAINSSGQSTVANHVVRDFIFEDKYWDDSSSSYDNSMLKSWYADITTALSAIDGDNSLTAEQKTAYKNRIHLEGLTIRYLAVKLFNGFAVTSVSGSSISTDSMSQIIADAKELGVLRCAEGLFYYVKPDGVAGWFDKNSLKDGAIDNLA